MDNPARAPAAVFHLGGFLAEELDARGWTTADLASRMPGDPSVNECMLDLTLAAATAPRGHAAHNMTLDDESATAIANALGVSPESVIRLEAMWHQYPDRRVYECGENN